MSQDTLDAWSGAQSGQDDFGSYDPLAVDMGDSDVTPGGFVDQEGTYHFVVEEAKADEAKTGKALQVAVKMRVLNNIPGQSPRGCILMHRIRVKNSEGGAPEEWAKKALANFFCGIGVCRREQRGERQVMVCPDGTNNLKTSHWGLLKGRQCWGVVEKHEYTGNDQKQYVDFRLKNMGTVYLLGHEKFKHLTGIGQCGLPEEVELSGHRIVNGVLVQVGAPVELGPNAGAAPTGSSPAPASTPAPTTAPPANDMPDI